jgi:ribosome biogenesis protein Nip4
MGNGAAMRPLSGPPSSLSIFVFSNNGIVFGFSISDINFDEGSAAAAEGLTNVGWVSLFLQPAAASHFRDI